MNASFELKKKPNGKDALIELSDLMNFRIEQKRLHKLLEVTTKTNETLKYPILTCIQNFKKSVIKSANENKKKIDLEMKLLNLIVFRKNLLKNTSSQEENLDDNKIRSQNFNSQSRCQNDELMKKAAGLLNTRKLLMGNNQVSQSLIKNKCSENHLIKSKTIDLPEIQHKLEINRIIERNNLMLEKSVSNYTLINENCLPEPSKLTIKRKNFVGSGEFLNQTKKSKSQSSIIFNKVPAQLVKTFVKDKFLNFNNLQPSKYDVNKWKFLIEDLSKNELLMNYAFSKKRQHFSCLDDLVNFFEFSPALFDSEKIWIVYVWIAENIQYDLESLKFQQIGKIAPSEVLAHGKCICQGFSNLFKYICERLGFECIKISGYSKGADISILKSFEGSDHAWNAVKIDNRWEYVDCTWSVGYVEKSDNCIRFMKKFQSFNFMTPPDIFIYDHYSENFQLQTPRISLSEFRMLPRISINYHIYELECLNHNQSEINTSDKRLNLKFKCPKSVNLSANLKDFNGNKADDAIYLGRNPLTNNFEIEIAIPEPNKKFILNLFAKYFHDESNYYDEIGKFVIHSNQTNFGKKESLVHRLYVNSPNVSFIESFLFYPLELNLKKQSQIKFKLFVKNASKLALVDSKTNWIYFEKSKIPNEYDTWYLNYLCNVSGKLLLLAKTHLDSPFYGIYSYFVVD